MDVASLLAAAPRTLPGSSARPEVRLELVDDLVAVHAAGPGAEPSFVVEPAAAAAAREDGGSLGPVYRRLPGGEVVVPTGRVLVRFAQGGRADERLADLRAAGYELDAVLTYAPHAAWVRWAGGGVAEALAQLPRLERLEGVRHVEAQVLGERRPRPPS